MEVKTKIKIYEINGDEISGKFILEVISHWNMTDRIVLKIAGDGYTVIAEDLIMAIKNAQNHK